MQVTNFITLLNGYPDYMPICVELKDPAQHVAPIEYWYFWISQNNNQEIIQTFRPQSNVNAYPLPHTNVGCLQDYFKTLTQTQTQNNVMIINNTHYTLSNTVAGIKSYNLFCTIW